MKFWIDLVGPMRPNVMYTCCTLYLSWTIDKYLTEEEYGWVFPLVGFFPNLLPKSWCHIVHHFLLLSLYCSITLSCYYYLYIVSNDDMMLWDEFYLKMLKSLKMQLSSVKYNLTLKKLTWYQIWYAGSSNLKEW